MANAQCMYKRGWAMLESSKRNEPYSIEELHPYNAWQLHTIYAQKGHGYV